MNDICLNAMVVVLFYRESMNFLLQPNRPAPTDMFQPTCSNRGRRNGGRRDESDRWPRVLVDGLVDKTSQWLGRPDESVQVAV